MVAQFSIRYKQSLIEIFLFKLKKHARRLLNSQLLKTYSEYCMKLYPIAIIAAFLFFSNGCTNPPDFPIEPEIEFLMLNKDSVIQGSQGNDDLLQVTISFTDGDGDLGDQENDSLNYYYQDTRFRDFLDIDKALSARIPFIPEQGTGNGISGEITLNLSSGNKEICCVHPQTNQACLPFDDFPIDTATYLIQIRDRAGNWSNVVETGPIYILCR